MQNKYVLTLMLMLTGSMSLSVQAHDIGYWTDSSGEIVRTTYGECIRSIGWNQSKMTPECGGEVKVMDADGDGVANDKDQCPGTGAGIAVDANGCAKDSDNDGVADSNDKCPGTAAGVSVDAKGCTMDSDNDGVADSADQCPGTAAGTDVDSKGCVRDTDNDGVADSQDKCPTTLAGVKVDASGCDVNMDSDSDGIADASDDCPGTASGTAVNKRGCELKADIRLDNVQFKSGTAVLDAKSQGILDNIAQVLKENTHLKFEVAGHTDNTGDYDYNVKLSEDRAQSVRNYLVDKGVASDRLTASGYGPDKPIVSNKTRAGRSVNRRVELVLQ